MKQFSKVITSIGLTLTLFGSFVLVIPSHIRSVIEKPITGDALPAKVVIEKPITGDALPVKVAIEKPITGDALHV